MANTAKPVVIAPIKPGTSTSLGPFKQVDAGVLNVGYAEAGCPTPVMDVHTADVNFQLRPINTSPVMIKVTPISCHRPSRSPNMTSPASSGIAG